MDRLMDGRNDKPKRSWAAYFDLLPQIHTRKSTRSHLTWIAENSVSREKKEQNGMFRIIREQNCMFKTIKERQEVQT